MACFPGPYKLTLEVDFMSGNNEHHQPVVVLLLFNTDGKDDGSGSEFFWRSNFNISTKLMGWWITTSLGSSKTALRRNDPGPGLCKVNSLEVTNSWITGFNCVKSKQWNQRSKSISEDSSFKLVYHRRQSNSCGSRCRSITKPIVSLNRWGEWATRAGNKNASPSWMVTSPVCLYISVSVYVLNVHPLVYVKDEEETTREKGKC